MAETKALTPDMLTKEGLTTLWGVVTKTFEPAEAGKGLSANDFTDEYKQKLEGMSTEIADNVKGAWKIKGTVPVLTDETEAGTSDPYIAKKDVEEVVGNVYSALAAFVTTPDIENAITFIIEEQGKKLPAGTNIVYTEDGWDIIAGHYDFEPMLKKSEMKDIEESEIDEICKFPELTVTLTRTNDGSTSGTAFTAFTENVTTTDECSGPYSVTVSATGLNNKIKSSGYYLTDTAVAEADLETITWVDNALALNDMQISNKLVYIKIVDTEDRVYYVNTTSITITQAG